MSFFRKLFASKAQPKENESSLRPEFTGVYSEESFAGRYTEDKIEPGMLDGCLKMIESYFGDNHISRKVESPINHPQNLDQTDQEGFGFVLYCKAFQLGENEATLFLAYAFSDFLIAKYGFKLYKDVTPEFPLRGMTLKYDRDGIVMSLYPFEYASKVLNGNQTFVEMENTLSSRLTNLPSKEDLLGINS